MPKFQYSAINQQSQNLNGVIKAESQEQARQKLKSLKLTIIGIEELPEDADLDRNKSKYKFEARNKEEKKVIGSIEADSILLAFKRLVEEYELTVIKLAGIEATDAEFETSIPQVKGFYKQIETLDKNLENDNSQEEYFAQKKQEKFRKTLEEILQILRGILNNYQEDLNPKSKDFLEKYTEHLNNIKFSQNYDSVIASANKILKYFQDTILYTDIQKNADSKFAAKIELMEKISQLKKLGRISAQKEKLSQKLESFGLDIPQEKSSNTTLSKILNELNLIFVSRSNNQTKKLALKDIFRNLKLSILNAFNSPNKTSKSSPNQASQSLKGSQQFQLSKLELELKNITFFLSIIYLSFYFISIFLSEKTFKIPLNQTFYIYQSKFLIYFIALIILTHSAINLRFFINNHKIPHSKATYFLFGLLILLIFTNL